MFSKIEEYINFDLTIQCNAPIRPFHINFTICCEDLKSIDYCSMNIENDSLQGTECIICIFAKKNRLIISSSA